MHKTSSFLLFIFFLAFSGPIQAQTSEKGKKPKTIAIIPPFVQIDKRVLRQGIDSSSRFEIRKKEAYIDQLNSYYFLARKQKKYGISIQNITQTNTLLEKAGLNYENLYKLNQMELMQVLGVDMILYGVSYQKPYLISPEQQFLLNAAFSFFPLTRYLAYTRKPNRPVTTYHYILFSSTNNETIWHYSDETITQGNNYLINSRKQDLNDYLSQLQEFIMKNFPAKT